MEGDLNIESEARAAEGSDEVVFESILPTSSNSCISQPTALPLRFSYEQCSSVSRMNPSRTDSNGWERRIDDVRTWA